MPQTLYVAQRSEDLRPIVASHRLPVLWACGSPVRVNMKHETREYQATGTAQIHVRVLPAQKTHVSHERPQMRRGAGGRSMRARAWQAQHVSKRNKTTVVNSFNIARLRRKDGLGVGARRLALSSMGTPDEVKIGDQRCRAVVACTRCEKIKRREHASTIITFLNGTKNDVSFTFACVLHDSVASRVW